MTHKNGKGGMTFIVIVCDCETYRHGSTKKKKKKVKHTVGIEVVVPPLSALFARARSDLGCNKYPFLGSILLHKLTQLSVLLFPGTHIFTKTQMLVSIVDLLAHLTNSRRKKKVAYLVGPGSLDLPWPSRRENPPPMHTLAPVA